MMDILEIWRRIPHRYPFLLVDRILELEEGQRAVGLKNVTINEAFFAGHYPSQPIMPGVLLLEALAQTGAVMLYPVLLARGRLPVLAGIDRARFHRMVRPGDGVHLEVLVRRLRAGTGVGVVDARAQVEGEVVCEAQLLFAGVPAHGVPGAGGRAEAGAEGAQPA